MDNLVNVSFRINKDIKISTHLTPNEETIEAMIDTQNNVDMHGPFNSFKEVMESINADD